MANAETKVTTETLVRDVMIMLTTETDAARVYKVNTQLVQYQKLRAALLKALDPGKANCDMAYRRSTSRGRSSARGRSVSGNQRVRSRGAVRTRRAGSSRRTGRASGTRTVRLVIEQAAPTVAPIQAPSGQLMVPDNASPFGVRLTFRSTPFVQNLARLGLVLSGTAIRPVSVN